MSVIDINHATMGEWTGIFIGLASVISAVGAAIAAVMAARNGRKITEIHDATNGMKAELVKTNGDKRYAEGRMHGEDFPRKRRVKRKPKPKAKKKNG